MAALGKVSPDHSDTSDDDVLHPGTIRNLDDWLPITASRNAKVWYPIFHIVTAVVGVGVLRLPEAMAYLGWGAGIAVLVASWIISLYTLWQMTEMHEIVEGKRFNRYHELGQEAFGKRLGLWIVVPQQLIVEVGVDIVYMLTGGQSLLELFWLIGSTNYDWRPFETSPIGLLVFIIVFASPHFFLAQLPNFNAISVISLAAAVMSLTYSGLAWIVTKDVVPPSSGIGYGPGCMIFGMDDDPVFGAMNALGIVAFAFAGHNVAMEIQATLPSSPAKPAKVAMRRGMLVAYNFVALCYFPMALIGYWAFGNCVPRNILLQIGSPKWFKIAANLMLVIHVTGSYQLYAMPVFDMLETVLVKKLHLVPSLMLRITTRCCYVLATVLLACTLPYISPQPLGFLGGLAASTTYFLPCIMWLRIVKPEPFSLSWLQNWFLIIAGFLLAVAATTGGLMSIISYGIDPPLFSLVFSSL